MPRVYMVGTKATVRFAYTQDRSFWGVKAAYALGQLGYKPDDWMDCTTDRDFRTVRYFLIPAEDLDDVIALLWDEYGVEATEEY